MGSGPSKLEVAGFRSRGGHCGNIGGHGRGCGEKVVHQWDIYDTQQERRHRAVLLVDQSSCRNNFNLHALRMLLMAMTEGLYLRK